MDSKADDNGNPSILRDCICQPIICRVKDSRETPAAGKLKKGKRALPSFPINADINDNDDNNSSEDLAEFIDYIATELFSSLPEHLRTLSYEAIKNDERLAEEVADPLESEQVDRLLNNTPHEVMDSLQTYCNVEPSSIKNFLSPVYRDYVDAATRTPPSYDTGKRAAACEICEREWIPLTYHHLIPRQTHAKAIKRGWHEQWQLEKVAWLCRACHSFVHRIAGNEELAREWWSVELLMGREDVQSWAKWVGRLRWKGR